MALAVKQQTPGWYAARRETIGSSDIPIIVGESSYKSAYTLAAEKLGLVEDIIDDDSRKLMDIGKAMQPVLLQLYGQETGRRVKSSLSWKHHAELPWATASLDGTAPVRRVVEAKWSNGKRWRKGEGVPGDVEVQVQWQLFVTGWDVADVVVLDHTDLRVETVERDDAHIDDILYLAREFRGYLERGELPPIDGSESSHRTWSRRHPRDDGTWLPATDDLIGLGRQLSTTRAEKKAAENAERTVANALRAVIGDASGIVGVVSLKKNADSERVNWPAVAAAYRGLLGETHTADELDTLQSIHTDPTEGARVLRLLSGKGSSE